MPPTSAGVIGRKQAPNMKPSSSAGFKSSFANVNKQRTEPNQDIAIVIQEPIVEDFQKIGDTYP